MRRKETRHGFLPSKSVLQVGAKQIQTIFMDFRSFLCIILALWSQSEIISAARNGSSLDVSSSDAIQ